MKITVSLTLDSDRDRDVVRWLEAQENKSAAVREAIRTHLAGAGSVTLADVLREIRELRRAGLSFSATSAAPARDEPPDVAARLDGLGL